ncbi:hypothetical protein [Embleya sp. AB8]|uniref:hypothetical protein n=1 Tax=Embleya sp. AB8 TaxID=3156304 RepID=UPI003C715F9E
MYASTEELTAFAEVLAKYDALYISHIRISHIRNGFASLLESLDELITIAERSGARAEVYHLKAAGRGNQPVTASAIKRIEEARATGLAITADIHPYEAGATGLDACIIPPRFHDGGPDALRGKLMREDFRATVKDAIRAPGTDWDNSYLNAGGADGILLLSGNTSEGNGMTLAQVAMWRGDADPLDTLLDIVVADSRMIIEPEHHAVVDMGEASLPPLGSRVAVVPNHCCAAGNPAEHLWIDHRGALRPWAVAARGRNNQEASRAARRLS